MTRCTSPFPLLKTQISNKEIKCYIQKGLVSILIDFFNKLTKQKQFLQAKTLFIKYC